MRVLYLAADPARTLSEVRAIQTELRGVQFRDDIQFIPHAITDPADFSRALQLHKPHIVHVSGSGDTHGGLLVGAETGAIHAVPKKPLAQLFALLRDEIRAVVLNAEDTWETAKHISRHVEFAVGMNGALCGASATMFSVGFYQAIGFGCTLEIAFELGKNQAAFVDANALHVPRLERKKATPAAPAPQGAYAVVLLRPERADPIELRKLLEREARVDPERAWDLLDSAPARVLGGLTWESASGLWTAISRLGAVASVETVSGEPTGRTFLRTSSIPIAVLPAGPRAPSFCLMQYPVSQALFERVMGTNPSHFRGATLPVEHAALAEAREFCRRLSRIDGLPDNAYRLPTEAEWEHAARAGTTTRFAGSDRWADVAWAGAERTFSVHTENAKRPNAWGLFHMSGNVWEWTDRSPEEEAHSASAIVKGGCFSSPESELEIGARRVVDPEERGWIGFRVARSAGALVRAAASSR